MKLTLAIAAAAVVASGNLLAADAPKAPSQPAPQAAPNLGAMHQGMATPIDVGDVKVAKASGPDARTVSEVVSSGAKLKDKTVVVRAKVVKFTPGVMKKNWLHVRDGSGSDKDSTNDLVVTTKDETKVGDVVLVKGVVRTDVQLGAGYSYKVLVEDATLAK